MTDQQGAASPRRSFLMRASSVPLAAPVGLAASVGLASVPATARGHDRTLHLHHVHTGESVKTTYFAGGRYLEAGIDELSWFLRDWRTSTTVPADREVLDILHVLARDLALDAPIEVLCGYRSPETNAMLRRRSRGVAKNSYHLRGMAIDLVFPGRTLATARRAALDLAAGGVGYYPRSGFLHLDSGPVRRW